MNTGMSLRPGVSCWWWGSNSARKYGRFNILNGVHKNTRAKRGRK